MSPDFLPSLYSIAYVLIASLGVCGLWLMMDVIRRYRRRSKPDDMACPRNLGVGS